MYNNDIPGYMTEAEVNKLHEIASQLENNSIIVEIGSWKGKSTVALAEAVKDKNCTIFCIDLWNNDNMFMESEDIFPAFLENVKPYDFVIPIKSNSKYAEVIVNQIDLLFIDGDHSEEGVRADIDKYSKYLKPGSYVLFHDYGGYWTGVSKAISDSGIDKKLTEDIFLEFSLYGGTYKG